MNDTRRNNTDGAHDGIDLLILALGILPALCLGLEWMRRAGLPAVVYMQNLVAVFAGASIAVYMQRRQVSPASGLATATVAIGLLCATLLAEGAQGVHRWIRIGPSAST